VSIGMATRRVYLLYNVQIDYGAHPASYKTGTGGCFRGVKRQGRDAAHSPPSNDEFKNSGAITLLPHTSSSRSA
jgi:hypothetical protein